MASRRYSEPLIAWTTITYRSVAAFIAIIFAVALVAFYFAFPETSRAALHKLSETANKLASKAGMGPDQGSDSHTPSQQQANFTAIEGTVRVRKNGSINWQEANFNQPLDKGDVVQTGADGIAKIVFIDGTNYIVKQDSLIVIEENSANQQQQTQVAVQVTTGTVDLATSTFVQGSRSSVIVAGATATFSQDSSAQVHNDPHADQHEIMVNRGSGEVKRNGQTLALNTLERVSFAADSAKMQKTKELGPPTLIAPANMMPIFTTGQANPIEFGWTPIASAKAYRLLISRSAFFSTTLFDKVTPVPSLKVPGLGEGAYYWVVQSVDGTGHQSVESEKNRFTVIPKGAQTVELALELQPFVQHGHVIEIKGHTEPNARVMVNGEEVPVIYSDGNFRYFTHPLPPGENTLTVTAQNARGGAKTMQQKVVIE